MVLAMVFEVEPFEDVSIVTERSLTICWRRVEGRRMQIEAALVVISL
jgi:hypothetical protein